MKNNNSVKIRILIDDEPGEGLKNEHGLSILVETEGHKILFDTGQSGRFAENAAVLGVNLEEVDFAVVSHGHYDHGNGLGAFFTLNKTAPVYIHPKAMEPVYFSRNKTPKERYIGIDQKMFSAAPERFKPVTETMKFSGGIHLIPCSVISGRNPIVNDGSLFIRKNDEELEETFEHEIFMAIEGKSEYLIISGCSHNNIASIIEYCETRFTRKKLVSVTGGFHMPGASGMKAEYEAAVIKVIERLKIIEAANRNEHTLFITGHCTGNDAKELLKDKLQDHVDFFHSGSKFFYTLT